VFFGGQDWDRFELHYNEELAKILMDAEAALMLRVLEKKPPDPDFTKPWTPKLLELLKPPAEKTMGLLKAEHVPLMEKFLDAKEQLAAWDAIKDDCQGRLTQAMQTWSVGQTTDGWRVSRGRQFRVKPPAGRRVVPGDNGEDI
jgi:hypothetical protein